MKKYPYLQSQSTRACHSSVITIRCLPRQWLFRLINQTYNKLHCFFKCCPWEAKHFIYLNCMINDRYASHILQKLIVCYRDYHLSFGHSLSLHSISHVRNLVDILYKYPCIANRIEFIFGPKTICLSPFKRRRDL